MRYLTGGDLSQFDLEEAVAWEQLRGFGQFDPSDTEYYGPPPTTPTSTPVPYRPTWKAPVIVKKPAATVVKSPVYEYPVQMPYRLPTAKPLVTKAPTPTQRAPSSSAAPYGYRQEQYTPKMAVTVPNPFRPGQTTTVVMPALEPVTIQIPKSKPGTREIMKPVEAYAVVPAAATAAVSSPAETSEESYAETASRVGVVKRPLAKTMPRIGQRAGVGRKAAMQRSLEVLGVADYMVWPALPKGQVEYDYADDTALEKGFNMAYSVQQLSPASRSAVLGWFRQALWAAPEYALDSKRKIYEEKDVNEVIEALRSGIKAAKQFKKVVAQRGVSEAIDLDDRLRMQELGLRAPSAAGIKTLLAKLSAHREFQKILNKLQKEGLFPRVDWENIKRLMDDLPTAQEWTADSKLSQELQRMVFAKVRVELDDALANFWLEQAKLTSGKAVSDMGFAFRKRMSDYLADTWAPAVKQAVDNLDFSQKTRSFVAR